MYKNEDKPPSTVEELDLSGTYTAEDYLQWKFEEMVELIRGKIFRMSPAPSSWHQSLAVELTRVFANYFIKKQCKVFAAPFDVYLTKEREDYKKTKNIVEPDLCVICDTDKIKKFGCVGAPDLMIEILSPSTSRKDQKLKFDLYEEYGVKEFWLVYPETRVVIVNILENGKYKTLRPATEDEKLKSVIFPELEVDLKELFINVPME